MFLRKGGGEEANTPSSKIVEVLPWTYNKLTEKKSISVQQLPLSSTVNTHIHILLLLHQDLMEINDNTLNNELKSTLSNTKKKS